MSLFGDKGSLRDALLFAALGLLPASALAAVGLRALDGEAAAVHRQAAQLVEGAARDLERAVGRSLDEAALDLASLRLDEMPDTEAGLRAQLAARLRTPLGAELVVLGFPTSRGTAEPARESAEACKELGRALLETGSGAAFLERCSASRDASGRWLFPVFAAAPPRAPLAEALTQWMGERGATLTAAERVALERDAKALTDPTRRAALERALRATPSGATSLAARQAAEVGARRWPDPRGLAEWSEGGSRGVLRVLDRARSFGFVVYRSPLEAALERGGMLPPDVTYGWGEGGSAIRAAATVAPALVVVLSHGRADLVESRARRKRWLVGSFLGGATLVVLALGSLVFLRVRQMRRTSELRADFVAAVSHELRTPIGSVLMLAELLEGELVAADERAEVHQALAREARRLAATVERLLELRRMLAGRREAKLELQDVALVVKSAVDDFEDRSPELPKVERSLAHVSARVDRSLLRLAVDNLLSNAKKYAPDGTPYEVRVEQRPQPGPQARGAAPARVVITVIDHGPGIAKPDQARIFAPFERADDRLSKATEGFGIGLALVRWAATQHGGEVSVESVEGEGARFAISFPARADREAPANERQGDRE